MAPRGQRNDPRRDPQGFDESRNVLTDLLGKFVPQWLVRRSIGVHVSTDRERYAVGDSVEMTVELVNRLPLPVTLATPSPRLWGWSVDGELEASDETVYLGDASGTLSFRSRERKVLTQTWDGRFKRVGDPTQWVEPKPGDHEIRAFLALEREDRQPADSVTIRLDD